MVVIVFEVDYVLHNHCHPRHVKREGPLGRGREAAVVEDIVYLE